MKIMLHQKQVYFNANHRTITTDNDTLSTVAECCKKLVKYDRLPNLHCGGSIESTTKTLDADRKRYLSGIFLPTIPQNYGITTPEVYSELAVRATRRTKTGNRTNNADCSKAVVEPLPHPIEAVSFNHKLTRTLEMLFKFLLLGEKRLTVRIRAKSEAEARQRIQFTSPAICIARFSDNLTACKHPPMGEVSEIVHSPMVGGHSYSTLDGVSANALHPTEQKNILHLFAQIGYPFFVVAKSTAEPGNSNLLLQGEQHAKRAFFVRNFRTPKINQSTEKSGDCIVSMVERNGKGSPFAVYLVGQFSSPLRSTAKTLESLAVVLNNLYKETVKMFYKFLFTGSRLRITVFAKNLAEAYTRLPLSQTKPVLIARLPVQGGIYA